MLILAGTRDSGPDAARLRRRAAEVEDLARSHYHASALAAAADAYLELEHIAVALADEGMELRARFWCATSLHGFGRHEEALVAMEDALHAAKHAVDEPLVYLLWTRAQRAEIELPLPLAQLEAGFTALEDALAKRHLGEWRARLLLNRCRLALSRGQLGDAIALGEEALARHAVEPHTYTQGAHYWPLVAACTWAGDLERAWRHLGAWSKESGGDRGTKVFRLARWAELERRAGKPARALPHAREAWRLAQASDDHQLHVFAGHALVATQLALGAPAHARGVLAGLLSRRHCEFGEHAHGMRVLAGDLALAEARHAAGLRALDLDFGGEGPPPRPRSGRDLARARAALVRAERRYDQSEARGRALDETLACRFRALGLAARRESLRRTANELLRR